MNRLLVICGHTATGKTSLALELAQKFGGELVSADSRQVYKYMDVVTGKDLPPSAGWQMVDDEYGYYEIGKTKLWGYDLVRPDQKFSVKLYCDFANCVITDIIGRGKLSILVGGTGLYIKSVIDPVEKVYVPRNEALRKKYSEVNADELLAILMKVNPRKAIGLNSSDSKNPRRLVRQIEIDQYEKSNNVDVIDKLNENRIDFDSVLQIGLYIASKEKLNNIIDERVGARIGKEMDREIEFLIKKDFINYAPKDTIGYAQWMEYLSGSLTRKEAVEKWKRSEHAYAKRQMTWFRKQKDIDWFDVTAKDWKKRMEMMVDKWYKVE